MVDSHHFLDPWDLPKALNLEISKLFNEAFVHALEATSMFLALFLLDLIHLAKMIVSPESGFLTGIVEGRERIASREEARR